MEGCPKGGMVNQHNLLNDFKAFDALNLPFNEQKYKELLERLEVSERMLSELENMNERFRFDAEFNKKEFLNIIEQLEQKEFKRLRDTDIQILHPAEIKRDFIEDGVWFFRTQNLRSLKIEKSNDVYISKSDAQRLKNNEIKYGDVLMTRTGANYGQTAVYNLDEKAIASSHVLILRNSFFNQFFLATFFNTKYGRKMIDKGMYGAAQPEISPYYILNIPIPVFSESFQLSIENKYKESEINLTQSQSLYRQAEDLLLSTLGLKNFTPSEKGTNIKSFKESFLATRRLDAEYYQVKYAEIIAKIKKQPYARLGNLVNIKKSIEPGSDVYSDEGLPFIRVADYNKFGISNPDKCLSTSYCAANAELLQSLYPAKETILFSKDGSVGTAFMLRENMQAITSGAILHLTVKDKTKVLPEYLTLALNSEVVKQQAERDAGGSIILHWRIHEIENVVVPIVDYQIQRQISALVEESFYLRGASERLLEEAKEMVEREIEN